MIYIVIYVAKEREDTEKAWTIMAKRVTTFYANKIWGELGKYSKNVNSYSYTHNIMCNNKNTKSITFV